MKRIIDSATKCFFRNTSRTIAIHVWGFYLLKKIWKWVPMRQTGENGEIAEPERFFRLHLLSNILTCLVKSTKACKIGWMKHTYNCLIPIQNRKASPIMLLRCPAKFQTILINLVWGRTPPCYTIVPQKWMGTGQPYIFLNSKRSKKKI